MGLLDNRALKAMTILITKKEIQWIDAQERLERGIDIFKSKTTR